MEWFDCEDGEEGAEKASGLGQDGEEPEWRGRSGPEARGQTHDLGARATQSDAAAHPAQDKPLVEPPEFSDRVRDTDKEPYWIPATFPTIFQNETGDPYNYIVKEPDLATWGPHILRSRGWARSRW